MSVRQSMGAIGSSADNAATESFNAAFKRETLKGHKGWSNEHEARLDAFRWLTRYNTRRRHSRLGQRSPIAYENDLQPAATTLPGPSRIGVFKIRGQGPVILIPLIETRAGVDNLAEIAAIDGIDFLFFGLADLSQDIGINMYKDGVKLVEIWNEAVQVAHAQGAYIGGPLGFVADERGIPVLQQARGQLHDSRAQ